MKAKTFLPVLLALALVLGITAFNLGALNSVAFAQGPKPTPPKAKAPKASVGTAFTYQGQLKKSGALVNSSCALTFDLYDASSGGTHLAGPVNGNPNPASVTNGLFTVQVDFGNNVLTGTLSYLQTAVQCTGETNPTTLSRQQLTPAPYAVYSMNTAWGQTMAGTGVGLTALSNDRIGLAGVATTSPFLTPFTLGTMGVYGRGDDVGVWGEPYTNNGVGVEGSHSSSSNYGQLGTPSYGVYGSSPSGVGVEGTHTNSGNFGEVGAWSAGVHGYGMGYGRDGVIGASFNGGNGVSGAAFNGGYAVYSAGDTRVVGNLQVDGQANGFFPRPAYDSGWVFLTSGCTTLNHNLGGDTLNYVVDLTSGAGGMNNYWLGGLYDNWDSVQGWIGFWYKNLSTTSVTICTGINSDTLRLRIWVYK